MMMREPVSAPKVRRGASAVAFIIAAAALTAGAGPGLAVTMNPNQIAAALVAVGRGTVGPATFFMQKGWHPSADLSCKSYAIPNHRGDDCKWSFTNDNGTEVGTVQFLIEQQDLDFVALDARIDANGASDGASTQKWRWPFELQTAPEIKASGLSYPVPGECHDLQGRPAGSISCAVLLTSRILMVAKLARASDDVAGDLKDAQDFATLGVSTMQWAVKDVSTVEVSP